MFIDIRILQNKTALIFELIQLTSQNENCYLSAIDNNHDVSHDTLTIIILDKVLNDKFDTNLQDVIDLLIKYHEDYDFLFCNIRIKSFELIIDKEESKLDDKDKYPAFRIKPRKDLTTLEMLSEVKELIAK